LEEIQAGPDASPGAFLATGARRLWSLHGDESLTAYERYMELYRLFQDRDRVIAKTFDDLRRSTATICLMLMWRQGPVTEDELSKFSPEVQWAVRID